MEKVRLEAPDRQALLDQLSAEHRALERRLTELESHISLTAAEQVERIAIKKLKLAKKDQMLRQRQLLARASGELPVPAAPAREPDTASS